MTEANLRRWRDHASIHECTNWNELHFRLGERVEIGGNDDSCTTMHAFTLAARVPNSQLLAFLCLPDNLFPLDPSSSFVVRESCRARGLQVETLDLEQTKR